MHPLANSFRSPFPTPPQPEILRSRKATHPRAKARTLLPVIPPHPVSISFSSFGQPRATAKSPGSFLRRKKTRVGVYTQKYYSVMTYSYFNTQRFFACFRLAEKTSINSMSNSFSETNTQASVQHLSVRASEGVEPRELVAALAKLNQRPVAVFSHPFAAANVQVGQPCAHLGQLSNATVTDVCATF